MATNIRPNLLIESEGASANEDLTVTRAFRVYDAHGVVSVQGNANNVTTLQRQAAGAGAFNAVSSALATDVAAGTVSRTTSIAGAQDDFIATDVLRWAATGGDGTGRLLGYAKIIPRQIPGQ